MPGRSSPSRSRISAMSERISRIWKPPTSRRVRACAAVCCARTSLTRQITARPSALDAWLRQRGIIGIAGVDTRALTTLIRDRGMQNAVIAHDPSGAFDMPALKHDADAWPGIEGMDLARNVTCGQSYQWDETIWRWPGGYGRQTRPSAHVVAVDYGLKRNILRCLATTGCRVTVVPATTSAEEILGARAGRHFPVQRPGRSGGDRGICRARTEEAVDSGKPMFGICLGHQLLGLALGGRTKRCTRAITAQIIR